MHRRQVANTLAFTSSTKDDDDPKPHRRADDFAATPRRVEEVHPSSWDPTERAKVMDEVGINMAALYPNLGLTSPDRTREECTVRALRAQATDVDTTPREYGSGDHHHTHALRTGANSFIADTAIAHGS